MKTQKTFWSALMLCSGLLLAAGRMQAATARDYLTAGDAIWKNGNPQGALPDYNQAKTLAKTTGDAYVLLDLSSRYLLLHDETSGWESFNYSTAWSYWWGWPVSGCSWCGQHAEYGKPALQEAVTYYNTVLTGILNAATSATCDLFKGRVTWAANLLQGSTTPPTPGSQVPTLARVDVSRTTLSHGRADSVRHTTSTNPDGLNAVAGFGCPDCVPAVAGLFTVIAAQPNPLKITMDTNGDGKADPTSPIALAAVNLPSCFTLAVAENPADSDGDKVGVRWTRPGTGTLFSSVAIPAAGIRVGMELATTALLESYTANSIIWEAPPVGTSIQGGHNGGGSLKLEARAIDAPSGSQTPAMSQPQSAAIDYAQTIKVDIVERCKQKNANGTFTIGVLAKISGNFEPLGVTWFRWSYQGNTVTIVADKRAANEIDFIVPSQEAGVSARITVVASSLGRLVTGNPNPFTRQVPAAPQSVGLDTFNSSGGTIEDAVPVLVEDKSHCGSAQAISAGGAHGMALRVDGTVAAWGSNGYGQLGDGKAEEFSSTPVLVKLANGTPLTGAIAISGGTIHSLAIVNPGGEVYAWGANDSGELGDGTNASTRPNPVKVVRSGGAPLANVVAVAAGDRFSLALTGTGEVFAWGLNDKMQLGTGLAASIWSNVAAQVQLDGKPLTGVKAIAAGGAHCLALTVQGKVIAWGAYIGSLDGLPANVVEIAAGMEHGLARTADLKVFAWGHVSDSNTNCGIL